MSKFDILNAVLNDRSPRLESTSTLCRIFSTHFWHIKCCSQWQVAKSGINQMKLWAFASLTALHAEWNKKMKCMQTCQIGEGSELLFDWSAKCQLLLLIQFAHFCNFFLLLWNYLSSSFGPHMDLSQSDFRMDYTTNGQEHEQHFASKKFDVFLSKYGEIETQKACRIFYEKGEVVVIMYQDCFNN